MVLSPGCGIVNNLNMMWAADNDGDPVDGEYVDEIVYDPDWEEWVKSATHGNGILFLGYPSFGTDGPVTLSYNWWAMFYDPAYDFGPRHREGFRDFLTGGTGRPLGDVNKYHVMGNGEIDYDMVYTATIPLDDPVWMTPRGDIAMMASTRGLSRPPNLLSVGPYDLPPGAELKVAFAVVGGEDLHTDPNNADLLPYSARTFLRKLDFSDLVGNAMWAKWIYDNPGVDTDGDGYAGEYQLCDPDSVTNESGQVVVRGDTVFYTGDGIPDWRSAMPPPAPDFWLTPTANGIYVRFNGARCEAERDIFTGQIEFEGYRIYCGLDQRAGSMAMVASYDRDDYDKYVWTGDVYAIEYRLLETPFILDSLRCLYGAGADPCQDSSFDPLNYTVSSPYILPGFSDSAFYFVRHDFNASRWGITTPIRKVYPDEPYPVSLDPDSLPPEALTAEGNPKYFEYEYTIENLLPTVPHWVSVTSFDFGAPALKVPGQESSVTRSAQSVYPMGASDTAAGGSGEVYVYPNPYRIDADYRDLGLEGRLEEDRPDYRVRAVHFRNLPAKCTIYIYSLDGDLVRRLDHDTDPFDPYSSHATWNLITRNTQMVVSGLYYWVVEAEDGTTQMGKLVIIM
ncbi:MAG: hypothetical protein JSW34_08120 [Candidatus Zixiibacteriota bacterium]|nr:MAG: hypothetical protein JSW34_08120 [candidate division Zixibacteria bacterium]